MKPYGTIRNRTLGDEYRLFIIEGEVRANPRESAQLIYVSKVETFRDWLSMSSFKWSGPPTEVDKEYEAMLI